MGDFTDKIDLLKTYQEDDFIRLTTADGSSDIVIDDVVLDQHISQAESIIKGYIQVKYSLPFTEVPEIIKRMARFLTYFLLTERKFSINDQLQNTYDNIIAELKAIQKGELALDTLPGVNAFQESDTIHGFTTSEDVNTEYCNETQLKGFI